MTDTTNCGLGDPSLCQSHPGVCEGCRQTVQHARTAAIERAARTHLRLDSLEPTGIDRRDFRVCHVSDIHAALYAAYEAGRAAR